MLGSGSQVWLCMIIEMRRQDLEADFELEYVATEEYLIPDISPTSWDSLVDR